MSVLVHRRLRISSGCAPLRPTPSRCSPMPARATRTPAALRIRTPRSHRPLGRQRPPCIVVYARPRCTASRLSAPTSPRSAGEFADSGHRAPLTPVLHLSRSRRKGDKASPTGVTYHPPETPHGALPPVYCPSADPLFARPMIFASSVCCCVSFSEPRRSKCNDFSGSQFTEGAERSRLDTHYAFDDYFSLEMLGSANLPKPALHS